MSAVRPGVAASECGWLELNGFTRASTVRDAGEYAVRGGIIDLFAPGMELGVRLDFFGDALESIRSFDPQTQRSSGQLRALDLVPMSEFQLAPETIRRFRQGYAKEFGAAPPDDILYEAVSEGRRYRSIRWSRTRPRSGSRRSPIIIRPAATRSMPRPRARRTSRCRRTGFI